MKKILIIEDDQIVANIYRNKFCVEGFQVEVASDGHIGLELVQSFRPDAVLLDLMLPKMTGIEVMKGIRSEADFKKIPIIVFSNTYLTNLIQDAWKAGATKCLSKSNCTPKQVIDVIRNELGANGNGKAHAHAPSTAPVATPQPAPNPAHAPAPVVVESDPELQAELRQSFCETMPANLAALRTAMRAMLKADNEAARVKELQDLNGRMHELAGLAAVTGMAAIVQMADALEALLKELSEKPKNINASTLRTVASAIDFLGALFERGGSLDQKEISGNILVVDDEAISRRAITFALEKARLKSVNLDDPLGAYKLLSESRFDLIFLDVDMPKMNGFELCTKLRTLPAHKKTPVVFVTSLNDFESRANSTMSGGNDFIAKPFLFIELAVKALLYVLRCRLEVGQAGNAAVPKPVAAAL